MELAVDEVIRNLKECRKAYPEDAFADDISVAITTMQKYQTIVEMINRYYDPTKTSTVRESIIFQDIVKVVKNEDDKEKEEAQ